MRLPKYIKNIHLADSGVISENCWYFPNKYATDWSCMSVLGDALCLRSGYNNVYSLDGLELLLKNTEDLDRLPNNFTIGIGPPSSLKRISLEKLHPANTVRGMFATEYSRIQGGKIYIFCIPKINAPLIKRFIREYTEKYKNS